MTSDDRAMEVELDKAWAEYRAARQAATTAADRDVKEAMSALRSLECAKVNADDALEKAEKRLLGVSGIEVKAVVDSMGVGSYSQFQNGVRLK